MTSLNYQFTYQLNPLTGDFVFADVDFLPGVPMVEIVAFVCRTIKGRFMPDPTKGLDYSILDKADSRTPARWKAEVRAGLDFLIKLQLITDVVVDCDPPVLGRVNWQVSFTDPALPGPGNRFVFPPRV